MREQTPRRVTRAYARGLVAAVSILALAMLVALWGLLSFLIDRAPVTSDVSHAIAPFMVLATLVLLVLVLWNQTIEILRGHGPTWVLLALLPAGTYLLWAVLGMIAGMNLEDTWLSPYAAVLVGVWAVMLPVFWAVLLRRVYSSRGTPRWPWEEREERERREEP